MKYLIDQLNSYTCYIRINIMLYHGHIDRRIYPARNHYTNLWGCVYTCIIFVTHVCRCIYQSKHHVQSVIAQRTNSLRNYSNQGFISLFVAWFVGLLKIFFWWLLTKWSFNCYIMSLIRLCFVAFKLQKEYP